MTFGEILTLVISLLIIGGLCAIPVWWNIGPLLRKRYWRDFAARAGLKYEETKHSFLKLPKHGRITGSYRGFSIVAATSDVFIEGGEGGKTLSCMSVAVNLKQPIKEKLLLLGKKTDTTFPGLSRGYRVQWGKGIDIGDAAFTRAVKIGESEPQDFALRVFRSEELRQKIQHTLGSHARIFSLYIAGSSLDYLGYQVPLRAQRLEELLVLLTDIAQAVEHAPEESWPLEHVQLPDVVHQAGWSAPFAEYHRIKGGLIGGTAASLLGIFLLSLGSCAISSPAPYSLELGLMAYALGLPFFVLGLIFFWRRRDRLLFFEQGLVHESLRGVVFYPWENMLEVWRKAVYRRFEFVGSATTPPLILTYKYLLVNGQGDKLSIDDRFNAYSSLRKNLESETKKKMLPDAWNAFEAGQRLSFGAISVDRSNFHILGVNIPIENLGGLKVIERTRHGWFGERPENYLQIRDRGTWVDWRDLTASQIPNILLLQALCDRIIRKRKGGKPAKKSKAVALPLNSLLLSQENYTAIHQALHTLIESEQGSVLNLCHPPSDKLIQAQSMGNRHGLVDFPAERLEEGEIERAQKLFEEIGIPLDENTMGYATWIIDFTHEPADLERAASIVFLLFCEVFALGNDFELSVTRD